MMKIQSLEFVRSVVDADDLLQDERPQIAFAGRSNVGKSSLLNRLVGRRQLARTSSTPGRTRAVNYFLLNERQYLVDLPGYGYAKAGRSDRRQWAEIVDRYLTSLASRARVIQLIDGKVGATSLDVQAFDYLTGLGASLTVAVTKIDRVSRHQWPQRLAQVRQSLGAAPGVKLIAVSARTGEGISELRRELAPER